MQYFMFASRKCKIDPVTLNTRIYSCILIRNDIPYRWRGLYNEDTDLSLRVLKDGWCTVLFNAFLCYKSTTMQMKGGNTDELYKDDGRRLMAESLVKQHPDVTSVVWKWGRWQHHVNYEQFKRNKLRLRASTSVRDGEDDYGMELVVSDEFRATKKSRRSTSIGTTPINDAAEFHEFPRSSFVDDDRLDEEAARIDAIIRARIER